MNKISAVYKIVNTVTNDSYVGSSNNVYQRWACHKCPSKWREQPNNPMYRDFQKYGIDKFRFQILAPVMPEHLKQVEQEFIEMLHPTYNNRNSNGRNVERRKESRIEYYQSDKWKEIKRRSDRKYSHSDKGKEAYRKARRKYLNQLCSYNGETLTLRALHLRFYRAGIEHPFAEARKHLLNK